MRQNRKEWQKAPSLQRRWPHSITGLREEAQSSRVCGIMWQPERGQGLPREGTPWQEWKEGLGVDETQQGGHQRW